MKIAGKLGLVTNLGLGAIAVITASIWWAYSEVENADRQRREASEIARGLSDLRLVTVEYRLYHNLRALAQWDAVSKRVDRLVASAIANVRFREPAQMEILADVREGSDAGRRLFSQIRSEGDAGGENASLSEASRRFGALLMSQLMTYQQENLNDALRLSNLATDRIVEAQRLVMIVILAGLALFASIMVGASWFIRREVLAPIRALREATGKVAGGDWNFATGIRKDDEIGDLSQNFDFMTQSLRKSFERYEHSNQSLATLNEELGAFSYSVSHDLRAPLRSMDGFSLVLLEDYGDQLGEEGRDSLTRIRAASQRMGSLIDDLLRLSHVTRAGLNVVPVDLSAMAGEIAGALGREQPGRSVHWEIEVGLSVHADPPLMRIAMQNLLQNAWKFTGKTDKAVIRVGALERDAKTTYFVADNGAGFDMRHADNLFGAFQRLHHAGDFSGSGIGLAIVQRIVRRHHGEVWAEAKEGEGATFFFRLKE